MKKMWALVRLSESEYDAVPVSWLVSETSMKYPLARKSTIFKKASEGLAIEKDEDYEYVDIHILKKTYENFDDPYENAVRKTNNRRTKSESEKEPCGKGLRKRKPNKICSDSDSDVSTRRSPKRPKRPKKQPVAESSLEEDESDSSVHQPSKAEIAREKIKELMAETKDRPLPKPPALSEIRNTNRRSPSLHSGSPSLSCDIYSPSPSKPSTPEQGYRRSNAISPIKMTSVMKNLSALLNATKKAGPASPRKPKHKSSPKKKSRTLSPSKTSDQFSPKKKTGTLSPTKKSVSSPKKKSGTLSPTEKAVSNPTLKTGSYRCKSGKKKKHFCGFRLKCSLEEAAIHVLCSMSADIAYLVQTAKKLPTKSTGGGGVPTEWANVDFPDGFKDDLPFQNQEDFEAFEEKLKDKKFFTILKQAFSWEHRQDGYVTRTARNLARDIIGDDEVPQNYLLKGGRSSKRKEKKLRFNTTSTYKLILAVVQCVWVDRCSEYEEQVEKTMKQFLIDCNAAGSIEVRDDQADGGEDKEKVDDHDKDKVDKDKVDKES